MAGRQSYSGEISGYYAQDLREMSSDDYVSQRKDFQFVFTQPLGHTY